MCVETYAQENCQYQKCPLLTRVVENASIPKNVEIEKKNVNTGKMNKENVDSKTVNQTLDTFSKKKLMALKASGPPNGRLF